MSQQILKVRPTKIELIRLKRRLKVAKRLHKVLKDRLIILSQELIALIREGISLRSEVYEHIIRCEKLLNISALFTTPDMLDTFLAIRFKEHDAIIGTRVVAGVKVPVIERRKEIGSYDSALYPMTLIEAGQCYDELMEKVLRLVETESSILRIGKEVSRVRRRVNALENILIPRIDATIKFLSMKFEEREREDKSRMKRVKQVLERRRQV